MPNSTDIALISLENLSRFKEDLEYAYGKANGPAKLDASGKIPELQLPSGVFSVVEVDTDEGLPENGEANKLYITKDTNNLYRWDEDTSEYVNASSPESVKYIAQTLTEAQKAQARTNIGAASSSDLPDDYVSFESQSLTDEQKAQARQNIGAMTETEIPTDTVKYTSQSLTDEQKTQARQNIGAMANTEIPTDTVKYTSQSLTDEQKAQARTNIGSASSSDISTISSTISRLEATILTYGDDVSDVIKINNGIRVEYANNNSKDIEIDADFPIKNVTYDENHMLHFLDASNEDMFDPIYIAGGGGGGGGGVGTVKVSRITNESVNCVYGADVNIQFSVDARDSSDDLATIKGSSWSVNGVTVARNVPVIQGNNSFNIGPYLSAGTNTVKITVTADTGGEVDQIGTKTWRVTAVNMRFTWEYDDTQINTDSFNDIWTVYGDVEKTSHTKIGNTELPVTVTSKTGAVQTIEIPMQDHGAVGVERWLTATIGEENQRTDSQYHEMIFAIPGDIRPIIAISMRDIEMNQYDTINIPVVVYDPSRVLTDAELFIDGTSAGSWPNVDRSVQTWSFTPTDLGHDIIYDQDNNPISGFHTLSIVCGETTKTILIKVNAVNLDIEEVAGYTFKFKSSEFASNNAVMNWESNGVTASFSNNFDWLNGGLHTEQDENGNLQQYFCVKAGTRMTIGHKPFAQANDPKARGMTFKIIYKVKNCRSYDAEFMNCFTDYGIRMYAHEAIFNSSGTRVSVPYGEDEYAELEFDVYPVSGYRYIMAWLDGVITSCRVYSENDIFTQSDAKDIVIGSDDCDVYIYMVKTYPMLVDRDGHIDNFIMDAPNAAEMSHRYERNDILTDGEIDHRKLAAKNKDCRVWLYDVDCMTNNKDDKREGCRFTQIWENGDDYYQISGEGIMAIQGTSSVEYRRGAANTDINFTSLEDGNGNDLLAGGTKDKTYGGSNNWFVEDEENPGHAKVFIVEEDETLGPECVVIERDANKNPTKYIKALGIKINDNSCPITYANTKVNFASCEQVNNMCNAAWYQRFNPYPSLTTRDCMEFVMGVQFINDTGWVPDNDHWVLWGDGNYHMYSIANMGNSKKNVHVFHDMSNPSEVCIEVNDNNDDQMRMVNPNNLSYEDYFASEDWQGKKYYGMRYPDTKNPSQTIIDSWYRLVWWMASNDPSRPTGALLVDQFGNAAPETYPEYTFRGHDRAGTQVLRGVTVTQYAGTYTHDTFERRMAKMLSECEDHMIMDSFMYHYLYLERHTMVDNVSKNNFWSCSEVGNQVNGNYVERWDLSKAYDMDTSDGNNNQGHLAFDYGNEWNDDIGGMKVFNGSDSVWFVFCANLYEAARAMFIDREAAGAWSSVGYHNFLLEQQRKVPERCWVQCYWYDYLRTYEQGINEDWMSFLDGGQKIHQRQHYEFFQELYDSSKYRGSASTVSNINFRAYTPNTYDLYVKNQNGAALRPSAVMSSNPILTIPKDTLITITRKVDDIWRVVTYNNRTGYVNKADLGGIEPDGSITVTMYNKMYISVNAGTKFIDPIKAERNVPVTIPFETGYINNMLVVVNTAPMIQAISGLEQLYPDTCNFAAASRLRTLSIGSDERGYENTFLTSLSLGNNTMLEYLYAQNLPSANSPLDLSKCSSLLYLDASGSGFTGYSFADGGLVNRAIVEKPTSLTLMNLQYLTDENLDINDLTRLMSIRFESCPNIDSFAIVNGAVTSQIAASGSVSLQVVRLIGINWIMPSDNILNRLLDMGGLNENNITIEQSVVAGSAYAPSMRQRNINKYEQAWGNDLTITYDNIVEEFLITFYNPDGTTVKDREGKGYSQYVDRGGTIIDPVVNNLIDTPTMQSTAQYTYTFTGWQNITGPVLDTRRVIATYDQEVRTYRVRWFSTTGVLLKSAQVEYGKEAIYQDETHTFPPVKTDEEESLYFWVFLGWDKSTGFVTEDTDVYAVWDRNSLPNYDSTHPENVPRMNELSIAQIYGIAKSNNANLFFNEQDYVDIKVGKDFNFSNIESRVLLEERYFNGDEVLKFNDIKLFDEEAPSFTLAVDYEFVDPVSNATLVSCCDATGDAEGFRVHYYLQSGNSTQNQSIKVLWGNTNEIINHGLVRGIFVLRHKKGSKNLLIASDNSGRYVYHSNSYADYGQTAMYEYDGYNPEILYKEIPRSQDTSTNAVLSFGAMAYGSEGFRYPAKGWIHWAKIWFDDLGSQNVKDLVSWPHETWRMHYRGSGIYNKDDGTGLLDGASFIANAALPQYYEYYESGNNGTAGGWKNSKIRKFVGSRCFNALPYSWQSIIKPVSITTKGGNGNLNVLELTTDKIYLPAYADMTTTTQTLYAPEGKRISWFVENYDRLKFMGITIPENAVIIRDTPNDPTLYTDTYRVKEGDIWIPSNDTSYCYVYVNDETISRRGYIAGRRISEATQQNIRPAQGTFGGAWVRATNYWLRSVSSETYQYVVSATGSVTSGYVAYTDYQRRACVIGFSI